MKVHCAFFAVVLFCKRKNAGIRILVGESRENFELRRRTDRVAVAPPVCVGGRGFDGLLLMDVSREDCVSVD